MKSQRITLIVLLVVSAFLLIEFVNTRLRTKKKSKPEAEVETPAATTSQADSTISVADSIAALYAPAAFKDKQMKYERVRKAYQAKGQTVRDLYEEKKIDPASLQLYLRVFKQEKLLEVWAKDKSQTQFTLLKTFPICQISGELGPKRKEGDEQVPEGFYRIVTFNPQSRYHLSLGLNYPNRSDQILGDTTDLGGNIFIHGGCGGIGGIPIRDESVQELYTMVVDAKAAGAGRVPVTIFPAKLEVTNLKALSQQYADQPALIQFWKSLQDGYLFFNECKKLPSIIITDNGTYVCKTGCSG